MKSKVCSLVIALLALSLLAPQSAADNAASATVTKPEGHTVSLELKFVKKKKNSQESALSFLDYGPNGYATGFLVGDGLVMTAYHVVSGDLSASKKAQLGFAPKDQLEVRVSAYGCQASVIKTDPDADLALLRVCG